MARDTELFQTFDLSQKLEPIFFFYTWDKPAITIGKIQRGREALIQEAEALGIPCYLRPTGGRAVLHGGDICYTFIGAQTDPLYGGTMQESFKKVNQMVIGLVNEAVSVITSERSMFINHEIATSQPTVASRDDMISHINCFSSAVCNEGLFNGHKIIGAAQAMGSRSFIQQGSIQINKVETSLEYFQAQKTLSELIDLNLNLQSFCDNLNALP